MASTAARVSLVFVWLTGLAHGVLLGEFSAEGPAGVVAYGSALVGALLLTDPSARPLRTSRAMAVTLCALLASAIVLANFTEPDRTWLVSFSSYLLALMIPRGNPAAGGGGATLLMGSTVLWLAWSGTPTVDILTVVTSPAMAMVVGIIWLMVLSSFVRREVAARSVIEDAQSKEAAYHEAIAATTTDLVRIQRRVEPLLNSLTDRDAVDHEALQQARLAEEWTRDTIRVPMLSGQGLDGDIEQARVRGAAVVLLGEPDGRRVISSRLAEALRIIITSLDAGDRLTLRALPAGRPAAVTALVDQGEHVRRLQFTDEGDQL